jgi:translation initiation factor eIF-2B subunit beta
MLPVELVIGNVVRRVLHIIREEMDQTEEAAGLFERESTAADSSAPAREGGLSRALSKSTTGQRWSRSFSLHNLLDQQDFDNDAARAVGPAKAAAKAAGGSEAGRVGKRAQQHMDAFGRGKGEAGEERAVEDFAAQRQAVLEGIADLIDELKDIDASIAANAPEHIHANEVVLTFGYSRTVLKFLKRAKEKRDFQVVVAEGLPSSSGLRMAAELDKLQIRTTIIADSMCYAMMARANKVIISAHALLADGGVMASVGTSILAAAARRHNVPVVVLAGIYKLSPNFPHEPGVTFNEFGDPSEILSFSDEAVVAAERAAPSNQEKPMLQVHNPLFDYIPPERISLFVTDHGHGTRAAFVVEIEDDVPNKPRS